MNQPDTDGLPEVSVFELREVVAKAFALLKLHKDQHLVRLTLLGRDICAHTVDRYGFPSLWHSRLPVGWMIRYERIVMTPKEIRELFPINRNKAVQMDIGPVRI